VQIQGAESIEVGDARVATRNGVAIMLLSLLTLGIWGAIWWYQVNRELRDYSQAVTRPFRNSPVVAVILFVLWPLAWFPLLLTTYVTARRVRTVQEWVEAPKQISPIVATLLAFVPILVPQAYYLQNALNDAWLRAKDGAGPPPDYTVAGGMQEQLARELDWKRSGGRR
jgi:hypothetical protein